MNVFGFQKVGSTPQEILKAIKNDVPNLQGKNALRVFPFKQGEHTSASAEEIARKELKNNEVGCFILRLHDEVETVKELQMSGRCNVNENIVKGARKWLTQYVIYTYGEQGDKFEIAAHEKKGDAMKEAKQYAMDNDCDTWVSLEKRLDGSPSLVADISPIKKEVKVKKTVPKNIYYFFGHEPAKEGVTNG